MRIILTVCSTNCRLPQTPRTPSSAAEHYFDDTFSRQRRASLGPRRPTGLARSLTRSRSIGQRSDFSNTTNGDAGDEEDDDDPKLNGGPSRTWSIYKDDDPKAGIPHEDPDDPINKYVQDQLQRIKSNESQEMADELVSMNDGADDH